jgi:hypothetical protein
VSGVARAIVAASALLVGCGGASPLANQAAGGGPTGVRAIDWQNRSYLVETLGELAVVRGHAEFALGDDGRLTTTGEPTGAYDVQPALFADVNRDGVEDAIISSVLSTGGTGHFSDVRIYSLHGDRVYELTAIPGGDRGDGGIRHVAVDVRAVIIDRNVLAEGDGVCCASKAQRERWVWRGGGLIEDTAARRPIDPARAPGQPPP